VRKTPLESWISSKVVDRGGRDLTGDDLRQYQIERLRETIEYVTGRSPLYRKRLAGYSAKDITDLDDFARLPFTTHQDIRDNGPQFLCVSQSEIQRVVTPLIPGATEEPIRIYLTGEDIESTVAFFHHGMTSLVNPGQKALILMLGERPGSVGDLLTRALARFDVQGIVHGTVEDPSEVIREIVKRKIDCLVGIPHEVLSVAKHQDATRIPRGQIKSVLLSADCRFSTYIPANIVEELKRVWGCEVFNHYGTSEMGFGGGVECDAHSGFHLREADMYFEIVDPDSGLALPPGELGEVVVTTLSRKGMPLVRYRTRDLARFRASPCPCGTVLPTLERVQGRLHEALRLRTGEWTGIADFDDAIFPVFGTVSYSVIMSTEFDLDRMDITIDTGSKEVDSGAVTAAALDVPAIRRAVEQGRLILGNAGSGLVNGTTTRAVRSTAQQSAYPRKGVYYG
jgi:phenylacetate-CoA ligase